MKKGSLFIFSFTLVFLFFHSCKKDEKKNEPTEPNNAVYDTTPYMINLGAFPPPPPQMGNKPTVQGVLLGRMLFYENKLSSDNSMNCSSCHLQKFGFSDSARFSLGVTKQRGLRQAMATVNLAYNTNDFFWDGRAHLLRDQTLMPIQDPVEMHETLPNVIAKLSSDQKYKDQFVRAFGSEEINPVKISLALEQFLNTIISNSSKYDKFLAGQTTLSDSEERGRKLFFAEYNKYFPETSGAECAHCHSGFNFENDQYMNNGLDSDAEITDIGREKVTNKTSDKAKFKVPSLRNVDITAPYMHDGRFKTLEEVVDHYNNNLKASTYIDPALENTRGTGLMLDAQKKTDLINFLKTLTDETIATDSRYSSPF